MTQLRRLQTTITIVALILAIGHHFWPSIEVDSFTLTLLLVAVLPWLAPLVKSVELPWGLKVQLQDLQHQLNEAKGAAASASLQAQVAIATPALGSSEVTGLSSSQMSQSVIELEDLAARYEHLRARMPPGSSRTATMTDVVAQMLSAAAEAPNLELWKYLGSSLAGHRLLAYSYSYVHPQLAQGEALAASLMKEKTAFGQYWALRALRRVVTTAAVKGAGSSRKLCAQLERYSATVEPGTDRYYELSQLLKEAGCGGLSMHDS